MAMPQRDATIEAIKRLDILLEYAVMHGDETEAERIREEKTGGCVGFAQGRRARLCSVEEGREIRKCTFHAQNRNVLNGREICKCVFHAHFILTQTVEYGIIPRDKN